MLAYDYEKSINKTVLNPLKEFVKLFKSQVFILNVVDEDEKIPSLENAVAGIKMEHNLDEIEHSYHFIKNEDIVTGINMFVANEKADMIAIIPRKHNLLSAIFQERNTKKWLYIHQFLYLLCTNNINNFLLKM